jgi:PAS domain-containing protein/anti-sigma regulatory factor (Ser/Thr protein kinase)
MSSHNHQQQLAPGETLADFEERYRAFIQNSTEGIWCCDTEEPVDTRLPEDEQIAAFYRFGYLAEANDAFARMYGFEHGADLVGARLGDLLVQDDPRNIDYLRTFIRSGYKLADTESIETDRDGNIRIFSNSLTAVLTDGKLFRAWGTQRDVTVHRRLEEALRVSEERFRAMFEQAAFPILVVSLEGTPLMANHASTDFFGGAPEEYSFLPEIIQSDSRTVRRRYDRPDGSECWGMTTVSTLRDARNQPISFLVTAADVTAQTAAERHREEALTALRESEERLRLALASGGMGTWDADLLTGTLSLSEEIPLLYGRPQGAVTMPLADWVTWLHPEDRDRVVAAFTTAVNRGPDYDVQFRTLWPDGVTSRWIATRALITWDENGAPVRAVGYTRNITQEKEQAAEHEEMLRRQRRFMREFVYSVTEGKFRLCLTEADLPSLLPSVSPVVPLTVPTLRLLRQKLNQVTEELQFALDRAQDVETAVGEAAMNAATHGGGGEGWICADPAAGTVQTWITDRGRGIAEEDLPHMIRKGVSSAGTLGHGFWLMLGTCDRVSLLSSPNGTTIVLEQDRVTPEPLWLQDVAG